MGELEQVPEVERVLMPLLACLEALGAVARRLHPPRLEALVDGILAPEASLRAARTGAPPWPERLDLLGAQIDAAAAAALEAAAGLRAAPATATPAIAAWRALGRLPRALEALYPLSGVLPAVSAFFLEPAARVEPARAARFLGLAPEGTGVMGFAAEGGGERGACWLYVPETYVPGQPHPLVMALHGGAGTGRRFLWSWLAAARSEGAILIAPTALGDTWSLTGPDIDTPHLLHFLDFVRQRWTVDPARLLLTGMSDGGTFTYASGLEQASPFTHLAPVAAAFHPLLAAAADPARLAGLPVRIIHGALDWMFPLAMAREAERSLKAAGAHASLEAPADLSHAYPSEINAGLIAWTAGGRKQMGRD